VNVKFTVIGALLLLFSAEIGTIICTGAGLPEISFLRFSTEGIFQSLVAALGGSMIFTGAFKTKN